jgi:hypothetical protein
LQEIGAELAGVESALNRLDEGTYGTCQVCGAPLDPGVLAGEPMASRCTRHSSDRAPDRLTGSPPGRLTGWPTGRPAGWSPGRLAGWPTDRLADRPTGRLAGWPTDRLAY